MIKYIYFERNFIDGFVSNENERVLDEKPETEYTGQRIIYTNDGYGYYIDIEKRIDHIYSLYYYEQEVYDRLLIQQRNKKLETL